MPSSHAHVPTAAAARYAKQLASHLGRKTPVEELHDGVLRLTFPFGEGTLTPEPDQLVLHASAADEDALAQVQDVLGSHLERFGQRNELTVTWHTP